MSFVLKDASRASHERGMIAITSEHYGSRLEVSANWNIGHVGADEDRLVFISVKENPDYGRERQAFTISRDDAEALRDRLTLILNAHDKANPRLDKQAGETVTNVTVNSAISDEAVDVMSSLAHELSVFYTDDLVDALNRHTDALNNFNK